MTDDTTTPTAQSQPTEEPLVIVAASVGDEQGDVFQGAIAAQGSHAVLVARFADQDAAAEVYEGLRNGEGAGNYHIDGVLVVNADAQGKVHVQQLTDHHTRKGLTWGVVGGVIAGIVFPPSILASAAVLGGAGAIVGKLGNIRQRSRVEQEVADVITAGTSGILALVDLKDVDAIKATIPQAQEVKTIPVDDATAKTIEEAAAAPEAKTADQSAGGQPSA
jgi:uncharacterized membrane protein